MFVMFIMMPVVMPTTVFAYDEDEYVIADGFCGDGDRTDSFSVRWTLTENQLTNERTLTISGRGYMGGYYGEHFNPVWARYGSIDRIVIEDGITNVGMWAFKNSGSIKSVIIGNSVTEIEERAFINSGVKSVVLPSGLEKIEREAFSGCGNLQTVYFRGSQERWDSLVKSGCIEYGNEIFLKHASACIRTNYIDTTHDSKEETADCRLADQNMGSGWYTIVDNTRFGHVNVSGDVDLILPDDCTFTATDGIHIGEGGSLTIWGQKGKRGRLVASSSEDAGIGGEDEDLEGSVIINGGIISATGGDGAAGIGGGNKGNADDGHVTINSGTVTATGGDGAAGIGGGREGLLGGGGEGANVYIGGGVVVASGGWRAIGAGKNDRDNNRLDIAGNMKVQAGRSSDNFTKTYPAGERESACRDNYSARIEVCNHPDKFYEKTETTHKQKCDYCGYSNYPTESHKYPATGSSACSICGYGLSQVNLTIIPDNGRDSDKKLTIEADKDHKFHLPDAEVVDPPSRKKMLLGWEMDGKILPAESVFLALKQDVTIKAIWSDRRTVTIAPSMDATSGLKYLEIAKGAEYKFPECDFEIEHKQFTGWKIGNDDTLYKPGDKITIDDSISIIAQWRGESVFVDLRNQPGLPGMPGGEHGGQTLQYGAEYTMPELPPALERGIPAGKHFLCWKLTGSDGDEYFYPGDKIKVEKDIAFIAVYKSDWQCLQQKLYDAKAGAVVKASDYRVDSDTFRAKKGDKPLAVRANGVTLDLDGITLDGSEIKGAVILDGNYNLTIKDSKTSSPGRIISKDSTCITVTNLAELVLNGAVISGADTGIGVEVSNGGAFTMKSGEISGFKNPESNGAGVYVGDNGYFSMEGGEIRGNSSACGSAVYLERSASFIMTGGQLKGNKAVTGDAGEESQSGGAAAKGCGGAVFINGGSSFEISGGNIYGNTAKFSGGGVCAYSGSFEMSGGEFGRNTALENCGGAVDVCNTASFKMTGGYIRNVNEAEDGAGVYITDQGSFDMRGGDIEKNEGGGVFVKAGTMNVSGAPVIRNNTKGKLAYNLCLESSSDSSGSRKITIDGVLKEDADIGVTKSSGGVFTAGYKSKMGSNAPAKYFSSDDKSYDLMLAGDGEVMLSEPNEFTVTFNTDGGSEIGSRTVKKGETLSKPDDPVKAGSVFEGWKIEGEDDFYDFSKPVKKHFTLRAVWHVHNWGEATYEWAADCKTVTAKRVCRRDPAHVETETVNTTSKVTKQATCEEAGITEYTASFTNKAFTTKTSNMSDIEPIGHDWGGWTVKEQATETETGLEERFCKRNGNHKDQRVIPKLVPGEHVHNMKLIEGSDAECEHFGRKTYYECQDCGGWFADEAGKTPVSMKDIYIPARGHKRGTPANEGDVTKATCSSVGGYNLTTRCINCGKVLGTPERVVIPVDPDSHVWGEWTVTTPPTEYEEGTEARVCKENEAHVETREIPKLKPSDGGEGGSGPGASLETAEEEITALKANEEPKGSSFAQLKFRSTKQTSKSVTLKWSGVKGASKYLIYGSRCGSSSQMKKIAELKGGATSKKITKLSGKKIRKGTMYKFVIVAADNDNKVIFTSKSIYTASKGGKTGNYKSVKVNKSVLRNAAKLRAGRTLKLKAKAVKNSSKLRIKKYVGLRYESSDTDIATVSSKGVIKAKTKGTCYVYAYAQNGVYKTIRTKVR